MPKKVVFDANFLLLPFTLGIDVYSEIERLVEKPYHLLIPDYCLEELKKIRETFVPAAILLLKNKGVKIMKTGLQGHADQNLSRQDKENVICTSDKELKKSLVKKGFKVISPRGNKKLEVR